ncbi:MAG: HRDC domain-containing protein, partial [Roseiarcus sp.]
DAGVLAALKALRSELAHRQRQPAYVIFPDRTLIEMAARRPRDLDALAEVHGVGIAKLEKYGAAFLAIIQAEADA